MSRVHSSNKSKSMRRMPRRVFKARFLSSHTSPQSHHYRIWRGRGSQRLRDEGGIDGGGAREGTPLLYHISLSFAAAVWPPPHPTLSLPETGPLPIPRMVHAAREGRPRAGRLPGGGPSRVGARVGGVRPVPPRPSLHPRSQIRRPNGTALLTPTPTALDRTVNPDPNLQGAGVIQMTDSELALRKPPTLYQTARQRVVKCIKALGRLS